VLVHLQKQHAPPCRAEYRAPIPLLGEILGAEEPRDTRTGLFRLGVGGLCRRMQAA